MTGPDAGGALSVDDGISRGAPSRARPRLALALRRLAPFVAVALVVVVVDQATKALVRARLAVGEGWPGRDGLLQIAHVENSGAAFGILQGAGPFLLVTTVIGVAAVAAYLLLAPPEGRLYTLALALILGGAVGNLIDRAVRGTVTDFIDPSHYPAFNVADSAIVTGVVALFWLSLRDDGRRDDGDPPAAEDGA